jgi:hypothetical protein
MTLAFTSIDLVREGIARQIERIIPRAEAHRDTRFAWQRDIATTGTLRNFDVLADMPTEVPGGAYGGGIEYATILRVRIAYDELGDQDFVALASMDAEDIAALLVRVHALVPGLFPFETERSRSTPLLVTTIDDASEEARRVVEHLVEVHYWVSGEVMLEEE